MRVEDTSPVAHLAKTIQQRTDSRKARQVRNKARCLSPCSSVMLSQETRSFSECRSMWHRVAMMNIRRANERCHAEHGWLDTYHTFSFANYYDPRWMGFRSLRVINDDLVMPGMGFGTHPHRDMEIITYILSGSLQHKDSMGNGRVIRTG